MPWLLLILPIEGFIGWRIWITSREVNKAAGLVKATIEDEGQKMRADFLNAVALGMAALAQAPVAKEDGNDAD